MKLEDFLLFFQSDLFQETIFVIKILSFIAIFIFISAIIWGLKKSSWLYWHITADSRDFWRGSPFPFKKEAQKRWRKVKKKLASKKESNWKLAVIEATEIVEEVLVRMGYKAETLRKRLDLATPAQIPNLKEMKKVASIYEKVISDPDYKLEKKNAEKLIEVFEKFLRYVEYL